MMNGQMIYANYRYYKKAVGSKEETLLQDMFKMWL